MRNPHAVYYEYDDFIGVCKHYADTDAYPGICHNCGDDATKCPYEIWEAENA